MKKIVSITCLVLAAVRSLGGYSTYNTVDGIEWMCTFESSEVKIIPVHPEELSGVLTFPKTVNDGYGFERQVTAVGILDSSPPGDSELYWKGRNVTSVRIPEGVTSIIDYAFYGCTSLTSIQLPSSLKSIGRWSFRYCYSLPDIAIPDGVTSLGNSAFRDCYALNRVHVGAGLERLPECGFWGCRSLSSLTFSEPNCLRSIGNRAFTGTALSTVSFPDTNHCRFYKEETDFRWAVFDTGDHSSSLNETRVQRLEFGMPLDPETSCPYEGYLSTEDITSFWGLPFAVDGYCPETVAVQGKAEGFHVYSLDETHPGSSSTVVVFGALGVLLNSYWKTLQTDDPRSLTFPYWSSVTSSSADLFVPGYTKIDTTQTWRFLLERGRHVGILPDGSSGTLYDGLLLDVVVHWYWNWPLTITSPYGSPSPKRGTTNPRSYHDVECSIEPFVPHETDPRIRYECTGWKGTGSVPATGTGTNLVLKIKEDSTLEWQWTTNFLIQCSISGEATSRTVSSWQRQGDLFVFPVETDVTSPSAVFSGDAEGVVFDGEKRTISIPADRPRSLLARIDSGSKLFTDKTLQLLAGGDSEWFLAEEPSASDGYCLRSGSVSQGGTSTVEMRVDAGGTISFDWKISANRSDWAYFYVDGVQAASITRATDWANVSTNLADGSHVLRWVFDRHAATAANDEAAFLDNVSWRPRLSLAVSSAYGTPSPTSGTSIVSYGELVSASVLAPAPADGTRRVCTGWTGTGSVPAQGTSAAFPFVVTKPSTLIWQWRTEHWIDLSVVSGGTTVFQPQWIENGKTVSVSVIPDTHLFRISLSGDTQGVTVSGTQITFDADRPRTIRVTVEEVKISLSVETAHGFSIPVPGRHEYSWGDLVWCEATEPTPEEGFQYRCTGWRGVGSAPSLGYDRQFLFRIEEPSLVSWLWQTNVCIALETEGALAVDIAEKWVERGSSLIVPYEPLADYVAFDLGGDSDGVVIDEQARTITIPADRPRSVSVTATAMSLASALDSKGLVWTTSGGDVWIPQRDVSSDGVDAAASGDATCGDNLLETSVLGPGTLSWFWKMNAAGWAGVDASVDGRDVAYLETSGDWTSASTQISGEGPHSVRFAFWTEEGGTSSDRAYLDRVSWTGATVPRATQTTPEAVPYAWLDRWPDLLAENGGDYESAAAAIAANGINTVWECFVAGLDPTDPDAVFRVDISLNDDKPRIDWTPDLGSARDYRLEGRTELGGEDGWEKPTTEDHRFFRARVALPDSSTTGGTEVFPGLVTITFDANGGTVEPEFIDYTSSGTLGILPTPIWAEISFLGWYSDITCGVRFSSQTSVPHRDTRLFARWNEFQIHFEPNGGTGEMPDAICPLDTDFDLPICAFVRDGFHFTGWTYQSGNHSLFFDADEEMPELDVHIGETIVFHACWEPNQYVVRFDSNGGGGMMDDELFVFGESKALSTNSYYNSGKMFSGWATSATGVPIYSDGEVVLSLTNRADAVVTLYAVWDVPSIVFDANRGEGTMDILCFSDEVSKTLPKCSFTRYGYSFAGWATSPAGSAAIDDCGTVDLADCLSGRIRILYATWSPNLHTISFDSAGGTPVDPVVCLYGQVPALPADPTRLFYVFSGWNPKIPDTMPDEDLFLTARWKLTDQQYGLTARYYENEFEWDNINSTFSTWLQSEETLLNEFLKMEPSLTTNTMDWGLALESGNSNPTNKYHGVYGNSARNNFNILLTGYLKIENGGTYSFASRGDDGLILYIDGTLVSQNLMHYWRHDDDGWIECFSRVDGSGTINLARGYHRICIVACEWDGDQSLWVQWKKPGDEALTPLPQTMLFRECPSNSIQPRTGCGSLTVQFSANGGSGQMAPVSLDWFWGGAELPTCSFSKNGYGFAGWALSSDGAIELTDGETLTRNIFNRFQSSNVTLFARWSPGSYMVQFDANGGTGTMPDIDFWSDVPQKLTRNAFAKRGMRFIGWATNETDEVVFADGETVCNLAAIGEKVILRAVWSEFYPGLAIRYYDISSSGYSIWTQSEEAMKAYFDDKTPTIATNTFDWGEGLDAGFSDSTGSDGDRWVSDGLSRPDSTCRFYGNYASSSMNRFAAYLVGNLSVTDSDMYQFAAVADDAVVLYIDGSEVLGNGQSWGNMATGEIELSAGFHTMSIGFYENNGGQGLSVQWKKNDDSSYSPIQQSFLFHRSGVDTVVFHPNGGTGSMDSFVIDQDFGAKLPPCAFSGPNGADFLGWSTTANGLVEFADAERVSNLSPVDGDIVTLYAKWNHGSFTVHFDANGGTGEMPDQAFTLDVPQNLATNAFSKPNHAFAGWATNENGNVVFGNGAMVHNLATAEATVTLWAVWLPPYMVVNLSGGSSATSYPVAYLAEPPEGGFNTDEYKTTKLVLRRLEPGPVPTRDATLTKPFYVGLFEVTQKQWSLVTGSNPSYFSGDTRPVERVSYNAIRGSSLGSQWPTSNAVDADSFLGKLRARTGIDFDLPTEAQWEYACRAGTTTTYSYGDSADGNYMWYWDNSSSQTHEVGTKLPNPWGLYDMHGNVWEWCLDWYGGSLSGNDPVGFSSGSNRVERGGSWSYIAYGCTSSSRINNNPSYENNNIVGFRLVRTLSNE